MFNVRLSEEDWRRLDRIIDERVKVRAKEVAREFLLDFFKEGLQPIGSLNQLSPWVGFSSLPSFPTDKSIIEGLLNKAIDAGFGARIAQNVERETKLQINSESFIDGIVDRINRKQVRGGGE